MYVSRSIVLSLALLFSACSYIPFSGGALTGQPMPPLTDWRELADIAIIQLETQPEDPYSVKLWMIAETQHLYVFAGDNHAQWAQNIDANPFVRLQAGDPVYNFTASRVIDQTEFLHFTELWLAKYDSDRTDAKAADNYLYRLVPR